MVQGQVLKGGGGVLLAVFLFNSFKFYHFYMYKLLYHLIYKIVLCIWRKIIFFFHHNFRKKVILSCLKIKPENNLFVKGFNRLKIGF